MLALRGPQTLRRCRCGTWRKASATIFMLIESPRSIDEFSESVPSTWKKAHSASFVPRALTMTSRSDSLDQAKLIAGTSKSLNFQVFARRTRTFDSASTIARSEFCIARGDQCRARTVLPVEACLARRCLPSAADASVGGIINSHRPSGLKEAKPGCTIC